jgi:hypothetical protein
MDCHERIGDLRPILVDRDNFDDILGKLKPTRGSSDRIALLGDFSGSNERAPAACKFEADSASRLKLTRMAWNPSHETL